MSKTNLKRLDEGKLYYSISEVCAMTGLEQHVLRYWESEFPQLRPKKNRSGNRAYRMKEIKIIRYIKYLLYEEMFTIPGAKKKMSEANMADLEGQLSLLRHPSEPRIAPEPEPGIPEIGEGYPETAALLEDPELPLPGIEEIPEAAGNRPVFEESNASESALRQEILRLKRELKELLAHLQSAAVPHPGRPGL